MNERKNFEYLALAALLTVFFGYFAVRVWDIDFWWHIATGKVILESGAIPSADPFGVYDANNVWGQTILKSQWLGQVLLYSIYRWFDIDGVILFRAALLTLCLAIVYLRCRLAETSSLLTLPIIALSGLAILHHTGERPQLFSFLYLSFIFLLFDEHVRSGKRWLLYCVPVVMLVWSNTHGGAVLGEVALGLYGAGYVLEHRWSTGSFNTPEIRLMFWVMVMSAIVLVFAPNGFTTIKHIIALENNPIRDITSEYASPWSLWPATLYYWLFIGVALVSLPGFFNKAYLKQGGVVLVMGLISMTGFRYIPLFILLAAPYMASSLSRMMGSVKLAAMIVNLVVLIIALGFLTYGFKQGKVFQRGVQEQRFPSGAVAYIKANQLGGRMFNTMNWGGYIIWQLQGALTVFVDGRMLDPTRIVPYTHILWATPEGKLFFDRAEFNLALVPYGNSLSGERYPLVAYLLNHSNWKVVYQDEMGYLFARTTK
jgi:hypothetical protein